MGTKRRTSLSATIAVVSHLNKDFKCCNSVTLRLSAECLFLFWSSNSAFWCLSCTTGTHADTILAQVFYWKWAEGTEGRRDNSARRVTGGWGWRRGDCLRLQNKTKLLLFFPPIFYLFFFFELRQYSRCAKEEFTSECRSPSSPKQPGWAFPGGPH